MLEDAGSSYGTWVDGQRVDGPASLRDGSRIRVGNQELVVERRRDEAEAGRTVVVRPGDSLVESGSFGTHPRARSGYALKRLEAGEGPKRWVLRDLESDRFLRMSDSDAQLFEMLDGRHDLPELVREAEQRFGAGGSARLARLLSELAERGLLAGVAGADGAEEAPAGFRQRLLSPREKTWAGAGELFDRLYRGGGWRLFSRPALTAIGALALAGLVAFPYLVVARYGTPFVVAQKVGVGALVFLIGRFAVVAAHETAHGLTMASYGRRVRRAGLKLLLIFPYAYVDTSEAWFEPRRRRIAISAAGPVSDLSLGALFALACLALPAGSAPGHHLPARVRRLRRSVLQPEPVRGPGRLPDPGGRAAGAGAPATCPRAAVQAAERGRGSRRLAGAHPVRGVRAGLVGGGGLLCRGDVAALRAAAGAGGPHAGRVGRAERCLARVLHARAGGRWAGRCGRGGSAGERELTEPEADAAAQLLERLLTDQAFRARFRRDPVEASREAGLESVADEMALSGGKAMDTLDARESRSSLAGVLMAAALEGVGVYEFSQDMVPHLADIPSSVGQVLSRIELPAIAAEAQAATPRAEPSSPGDAGEFRAITPDQVGYGIARIGGVGCGSSCSTTGGWASTPTESPTSGRGSWTRASSRCSG